jgi:hypothetical protein
MPTRRQDTQIARARDGTTFCISCHRITRFEQIYESGSGWNEPGAASLLRLDIRPADRP